MESDRFHAFLDALFDSDRLQTLCSILIDSVVFYAVTWRTAGAHVDFVSIPSMKGQSKSLDKEIQILRKKTVLLSDNVSLLFEYNPGLQDLKSEVICSTVRSLAFFIVLWI